jgi:phenylacetate-CoA ligase
MQRVIGRTDDMLIIRGVNVFPSQIEELLCSDPELSSHYLIEIARPSRLDEMIVRVEVRPDRNVAADEARSTIARRVETRIKDMIGIKVSIAVHAPGTIERSAGKARRVIDLRSKP